VTASPTAPGTDVNEALRPRRPYTPLARMPVARLEVWMRKYYFATEIDTGGSGVEDYALADLRRILGLAWEELDGIVFHDSQTLGGEVLRQAIAARWGGGDAHRVMATHGSTEATFLLLSALLAPGDEVVVTDPCYPQLHLIAEAMGCRMARWPLRRERGFVPEIDEGLGLIGPRTRLIVLNFPHNPTGATLAPEGLAALVAAAAKVGAYLLWDDAFGALTYDAPPLPDPTLLYERAILIGTLSKAYGLPGLRVGWCVAAPEVLDRCVRLRDYTTLHLSPLVERIASAAIAGTEALVGPRLAQARANRATVLAWIAERGDLEAAAPRGGVTLFPRLPPALDVEAFCHRLAREEKVLLVPGSCFGHPQHVRLGFGGPAAALQEGLARCGRLLDLAAR